MTALPPSAAATGASGSAMASGASDLAGAPTSVPPTGWSEWVEASCQVVEAAGQWRQPKTFDAHGPVGRLGPAVGPAAIARRPTSSPSPPTTTSA